MELQKPGARIGFSPEFKRELVEKIVVLDKTLGDLADEMGIPAEVMRKWTLMVERTETEIPIYEEPPVPAWRARQLQRGGWRGRRGGLRSKVGTGRRGV
jgi:transposase-like protein